MVVPDARMKESIAIAKATTQSIRVGDPCGDADMGPVVSRPQWEKVQRLIQRGSDEGGVLFTGRIGPPSGLPNGHYVKPTIFAHVGQEIAIARKEIFGPVPTLHGYDATDGAVAIGNDTEYYLYACFWGGDLVEAQAGSTRLRFGR
jgi:aldehyde dehydrogenase (NAD+)